METVKITKIFKTNKDKNGNELKTKDGRNYTRLSIKTSQHGEKYLSGFENAQNKDWQEGDEVEIITKQNGEYLNFDTPKKDDKVIEMLSHVLTKLGNMSMKLDAINNKIKDKPLVGLHGEPVDVDPFGDEPEF